MVKKKNTHGNRNYSMPDAFEVLAVVSFTGKVTATPTGITVQVQTPQQSRHRSFEVLILLQLSM